MKRRGFSFAIIRCDSSKQPPDLSACHPQQARNHTGRTFSYRRQTPPKRSITMLENILHTGAYQTVSEQ